MNTAAVLLVLMAQLAATDPIPVARDARHLIIPFVGYEHLNDMQVGYGFNTSYQDISNDNIPVRREVNQTFTDKRDLRASVLGLLYRYNVNRMVGLEASLASVHSGESEQFLVRYEQNFDIGTFVERTKVSVTRKNIVYSSLDGVFSPPINNRYISGGIRFGGGYAIRSVEFTPSRRFDSVTSLESDAMFLVRGGIDLTLWQDSKLLIQSSLLYTSYLPTDSDIDSFGGIGWRVAILPMWSVR